MRIAYLAPEIPARSATFVYNEMNALMSKGIEVSSFSLHYPSDVANREQSLLQNTTYLYKGGVFSVFFKCLLVLLTTRIALLKSLRLLQEDIKVTPDFKQKLKLVFQYMAAINLAAHLKKGKVQHLHVHFAHVPTQVAMYASALADIPFTVTSHANDIFERALLLPEKAKRSAKFYTISNYNLKYLESQGLNKEKLAVVRCGVSLNYKYKTPNIHSKANDFVIGTLGRLVEKKGVDDLLVGVKKVKDRNPKINIRVEIAGDGPLHNNLLKLTDNLSISDSVIFLGALNHTEVADWLDTLDLFILASKKDNNGDMDGIPVVLMEAMSQSVPVISTNISGIPELVVDHETGLLADPGNPDSLSSVISTALTNTSKFSQMTSNALKHVENEFSMESNVQRLLLEFRKSTLKGTQ